MKFSILAVLVASAAAFAPSAMERSNTALNMNRREVIANIATTGAAAAFVPLVANADGAVSAATVTKARVKYGARIADLASAVSAGDFDAVAEEKNAFILFNSGAYPTSKSKDAKAAAIAGTNKIFAAIRAKDKAALASAYKEYVASNSITGLPDVDADKGQGYSSDYSYLAKTKAAAIYVR